MNSAVTNPCPPNIRPLHGYYRFSGQVLYHSLSARVKKSFLTVSFYVEDFLFILSLIK